MHTKTDNSHLADKVALRVKHSPWPQDRPLRVLDAYGGRGLARAAVGRLAGRRDEAVGRLRAAGLICDIDDRIAAKGISHAPV